MAGINEPASQYSFELIPFSEFGAEFAPKPAAGWRALEIQPGRWGTPFGDVTDGHLRATVAARVQIVRHISRLHLARATRLHPRLARSASILSASTVIQETVLERFFWDSPRSPKPAIRPVWFQARAPFAAWAS